MSEQTEHNKKKIIEALEKSFGIVTTACRTIGIGRTQFYQWLKDDAEFKKKVNDLQNVTLDMAESQLHKQILKGNTTATIFYLKTKGKKRGYVERQEITGVDGENVFSIKIIDDGNTDK
jgi:aspartate ammonia-lyase